MVSKPERTYIFKSYMLPTFDATRRWSIGGSLVAVSSLAVVFDSLSDAVDKTYELL